jgi:Leucine-rich repeat (LRR) protein
MGNFNSSDHDAKGKSVVESKLNMSLKTGVLNISNQDLKRSSSVWNRLRSDEFSRKLTSIDISRNKLKEFPTEILNLLLLKHINFSSCMLSSIPNFDEFDRLVTISGSDNELTNNFEVRLASSSVQCDFSNNRFEAFPSFLLNLSNLSELDLSSNQILFLDGIGTLVSLTILNLDDNIIMEVPEEIGNLSKLKRLSLKRNQLAILAKSREGYSLPSVLFLNTSIDNINLEGNNNLKKSEILALPGIEVFLERRQKTKDKALHGGALTDLSLFGID